MISAFLSSIPAPNKISFPGFGIGEFVVDPVAFKIPLPWADGAHPIMWYGIIITLAMIIGFAIANRKAKYEGIKSDDMFDLALYLIIFCMLGARLYYVLSKPWEYDSFLDVIAIWNGGLAIYGGVIAGALTILVYSKIKKINPAKLLDTAAPGLIIGQSIGRWGNFFNAEAHGEATDIFCRMGISAGHWLDRTAMDTVVYSAAEYYHPTFLYESLWNFVGFALIMLFYKRKRFDGQNVLFYLIWYGFGRFFIEGLRTDSLYLLENVLGQTVRVSQLVAALCVVGGGILMAAGLARAKRRAMDAADYDEVYTAHAGSSEAAESDENVKESEEN